MAAKQNGNGAAAAQNGAADGASTSQDTSAAVQDNSFAVKALYCVTVINQTCMFVYYGMMPVSKCECSHPFDLNHPR